MTLFGCIVNQPLQQTLKFAWGMCRQANALLARPLHMHWGQAFVPVFIGRRQVREGLEKPIACCKAICSNLVHHLCANQLYRDGKGAMLCWKCASQPSATNYDQLKLCYPRSGHPIQVGCCQGMHACMCPSSKGVCQASLIPAMCSDGMLAIHATSSLVAASSYALLSPSSQSTAANMLSESSNASTTKTSNVEDAVVAEDL